VDRCHQIWNVSTVLWYKTYITSKVVSIFLQSTVCLGPSCEISPYLYRLICKLPMRNCLTLWKTYLHTWNTSFTTSSTCSIPSSVRSTLIPKKPNPRAPVRAPPTRLLHQPFVLSTDSKLPGPSWPNRWLR
jgi:hypothetical protein